MEYHNIEPVYDENSKILILGSFPSVKSREIGFFYGHPRNRFWRVLSAVLNDKLPETTKEKKAFLLRNGIAVWDVIASCDINASSDNSIKNALPNDLTRIFKKANIRKIFANGNTAYKLFLKYNKGNNAVKLPSTSPANAAFSLERLTEIWSVISD